MQTTISSVNQSEKISVKINKLAMVSMLLCAYSMLFGLLMLFNGSYQQWISLFACIIAITIGMNLFCLNKAKYRILSFFVVWILILYLFNFGQVILYGFFPNYHTTKVNYIFPETESIKKGLSFSYWIINSFVIGGISIKNKQHHIQKVTKKKYSRIMMVFLFVFFPLQIFYIYKMISISSSLGYDEALHTGFSGVFIQLASLYLIGFVMLLIHTKQNKKMNSIIFILEMLFVILSMLSGSRIYAVASAIILVLIYFNGKKISIIKFLFLTIVLFLLMQFISAISIVRNVDGFDFGLIFKNMFSLENNVVLLFLEEFGCSIYSVILPIEQVPSKVNYGFGISYISSTPLFLINMPGINIQQFMQRACYMNYLYGTTALGGSLIGELYFNFGFFISVPIAFLCGKIMGKISKQTSYYLNQSRNINLLYLIMIMYTSIIWVRDYFSIIVRPVIWGVILIYFLKCLFIRKRGKMNETEN